VHRLLENEEIKPDDVLNLRDSLEYYLDQNQSPDFVFDDAMYDELPMEKLDAKVGEELTSCEVFYCISCGHEFPAPTCRM
jgi:CCR4-NOT transcriptional regulation complex NOT5 subunit